MTEILKVIRAIEEWGRTEFPKAYLKQHVRKKDFEFAGVLDVSMAWKDGDLMIVKASIQFSIGEGAEIGHIMLQLDENYNVVGFDATKGGIWSEPAPS